MDEYAADFEWYVSEFIQRVLSLLGSEDTRVCTRTRSSNQAEQVQMVVQEAQWLDTETILKKLPNIEPSEVQGILDRLSDEELDKVDFGGVAAE